MSREFKLHEYDALRAEILYKMKFADESFRFMLISVAALMSWIATNGSAIPKPLIGPIGWLPFAVSVFFYYHRANIAVSIKVIGRYIYDLEESLSEDGKGWEHRIPLDKYFAPRQTLTALGNMAKLCLFCSFLFGCFYTFESLNIFDLIQGIKIRVGAA